MNIKGIGIDIVDVNRIKVMVEKNRRLREKVFTSSEIAYSEKRKNRFEHYAARFAAKEAVIKAFSRRDLAFKDIEVVNLHDGKPCVRIHNKKIKTREIHLSLSHTNSIAVAQVVVVK